MMTKEGSTKIINFMTHGVLMLGCDHISHIVKKHNFFKNLLLYSQAWIKATNCIEMMRGRVQQNFKFHDTRVLMLGCGHISHVVKMYYLLLY